MNAYKKNIILVPDNFDGATLAKGILSLDCYEKKVVGRLRCYNLGKFENLVLGIAVNRKLNKIKVEAESATNFIFEKEIKICNTDDISIVLVDVKQNSHNIVLWGSTILNTSWKTTLELMLQDEEKSTQKLNDYNFAEQENNYQKQNIEEHIAENEMFDYNKDVEPENLQNEIDEQIQDLQSYQTDLFENASQNNQNDSYYQNEERFDFSQNVNILQGENFEQFVEDISKYEEKKSENLFDKQISKSENKKQNFYDRISYQIEKMFDANPQEKVLNEIIPNSKFCKVDFDDKTGSYVFGVIYQEELPKYLCYGVPAKKDSVPPRELSSFYQWLPVDVEDEAGDGYYMMYQDAESGSNISVEIV